MRTRESGLFHWGESDGGSGTGDRIRFKSSRGIGLAKAARVKLTSGQISYPVRLGTCSIPVRPALLDCGVKSRRGHTGQK